MHALKETVEELLLMLMSDCIVVQYHGCELCLSRKLRGYNHVPAHPPPPIPFYRPKHDSVVMNG